MKKNDLVSQHQESVDKLKEKVAKIESQLLDIRMEKQLNQSTNLHQERNLRKDIAQLKTIIRIKELTAKQS